MILAACKKVITVAFAALLAGIALHAARGALQSHDALPRVRCMPHDKGVRLTLDVGGKSTVISLPSQLEHCWEVEDRPTRLGDYNGYVQFAVNDRAALAMTAKEATKLGLVNVPGLAIGCYNSLVASPPIPLSAPSFFASSDTGDENRGAAIVTDRRVKQLLDIDWLIESVNLNQLPCTVQLILSAETGLLARTIGMLAESPLSNLVIVPPLSHAQEYAVGRIREFLSAHDLVARGWSAVEASVTARIIRLKESTSAMPTAYYRSRCAILAASHDMTVARALARLENADDGADMGWLSEMLATACLACDQQWAGVATRSRLRDTIPRAWTLMEEQLATRARVEVLADRGERIQDLDDFAPDILAFGQCLGVLEDCGCKGPSYGGLARIAEFLEQESSAKIRLRVGLGNYWSLPASSRFDDHNNTIAARLVDSISKSAYVNYGPIDLVAACLSADAMLQIEGSTERTGITCNVRHGRQDAIGKPRIVTAKGRRCLLLGVCGKEDPGLTTYDAALIRREFCIESPPETVACVAKQYAGQFDMVIIACSGLETESMVAACCHLPTPSIFLTAGESTVCYAGRMRKLPALASLREYRWSVQHHITSAGITAIRLRNIERHAPDIGYWLLTDFVRAQWLIELLSQSPQFQAKTEAFRQSAYVNGHGSEPLKWAGSSSCRTCHEVQFLQWRSSSHAQAMKSLASVQRQHVAMCVQCHVTGYLLGGYEYGRNQALDNVGCEACHGAGGEHTRSPARSNIRRVVQQELCETCHTPEHSLMSGQNFEYYLSRVRH